MRIKLAISNFLWELIRTKTEEATRNIARQESRKTERLLLDEIGDVRAGITQEMKSVIQNMVLREVRAAEQSMMESIIRLPSGALNQWLVFRSSIVNPDLGSAIDEYFAESSKKKRAAILAKYPSLAELIKPASPSILKQLDKDYRYWCKIQATGKE